MHVVRSARVLGLALLLLPGLLTFPPYAREDYVRRAASPYAFHLAAWEVQQLAGRLPTLLADMTQPPGPNGPLATPEESLAVREFFTAADRWQQARVRRASDAELATLRAEWMAARPPAQAAIARALATLAAQ